MVVFDGFEQEHDAFTEGKLNYKTPPMQTVKASFHQRQSRSRSRKRSRKSAYDLVKIKNRSRKRSHKCDGIGVRRIKTLPFLPTPSLTGSAYDLVKTRLSESDAEAEG